MAYQKRVYTEGIEEVTYQDMNRIEEGIEANDLAIDQINSDNIERDKVINAKETPEGAQSKSDAALKSAKEYTDEETNKRVLQTEYDTKMAALDSKNTEQDTAIANKVNNSTFTATKTALETKNTEQDNAIAEKVKLNGSPTNVNFIKNKVVQDGLVENNSSISSNNIKTVFLKISGSTTYNEIMDTRSNQSGWLFDISSSGQLRIRNAAYQNFFKASNGEYCTFPITGKLYDLVFMKLSINEFAILLEGEIYTAKLEVTERIGKIRFGSLVKNNFVYCRNLTYQEINRNLSVLNNSPSLSGLETTDSEGHKTSHLFASDTDHVTTRTGHTDEERYTALLGKFGKKFTSTGEDITVNNAIERQRVLSGKISGQTVKNYAKTSKISILDTETGWRTKVTKVDKSLLVPSSNYYLHAYVFSNTLDGRFIISQDFKYNSYSTFVGQKYIDKGFTGYLKFEVTTTSDLSLVNDIGGVTSQVDTMSETGAIEYAICITDNDIDLSNAFKSIVSFGLNSSQAILSNNGLKYPFYKSLEDKLAGKVIELAKAENAFDTFEIMEDGSGVLTQNIKQTIINTDKWFMESPPLTEKTLSFLLKYTDAKPIPNASNGKKANIICSHFTTLPASHTWTKDEEGISLDDAKNTRIRISKEKLTTPDLAGFKEWITTNLIALFYELEIPIVTHIPKELCPAIVTQQTNIFSVDSAVKPSELKLKVPVDRISELEARLNALEALNL